ncbi:MAG TPA: MFS transporter [Aggregatilineales bacterium]|nr:MFS transporter [Aggregatilineales bacterium]
MNQPRHLRRNFTLFYLDYIIFSIAFAMIGASTVVPDFVKRITPDPQIIGIAGVMFNFCWLLPQLFFSQMVNRSTQRAAMLARFVVPVRLFFIILAAIMLLTTNTSVILVVFLICYGLFAVGDGFVTLLWADLLGSTLTNRARSMLFSLGQLSVAFAVLGSREVVRYFLAPEQAVTFPRNYIGLFAIAGVIFVIAGVCLSLLREEQPEEPLQPGPTVREFLPFLGQILRTDADFRRFAGTRVILDLATLAIPFYIVFAESALGINSETIVGDSILLITIGSAVGALIAGWLSRRYGSRTVIRMTAVMTLLHPLLAVSSVIIGSAALYAVFFALGAVGSTIALGYFDWVITHAPPSSRPIYLGLTNTISAVSNLAPALGGVILGALLTPMGSPAAYLVLFAIAAVMALSGLVSAFTLKEPRPKDLSEMESATAEPSIETAKTT